MPIILITLGICTQKEWLNAIKKNGIANNNIEKGITGPIPRTAIPNIGPNRTNKTTLTIIDEKRA